VYPQASFNRQRQFNATVAVSRHEQVVDIISSSVQSIRKALLSGQAKELHLVLLGADKAPVEQYAFRLCATAEPAVPLTVEEATAAFGGALSKLALLDMIVPRATELDSFTFLLVASSPVDDSLAASSSDVAKRSLEASSSSSSAAAAAAAAVSAATRRPPSVWMPLTTADPEALLLASSEPPTKQIPLKTLEAARLRASITWIGTVPFEP
jgi:hypothetical protein